MPATRRVIFALPLAAATWSRDTRVTGEARAAEGGRNDPRWADDPRLAQLWRCTFRECPGYIYDPLVGEARQGIPPRTAFEDLPDDFTCPKCASGKRWFRKHINRAEL